MGNLNFDASNIKPNDVFDPLPPSWYAMRIIAAELRPTEKAGEMLVIEHEIDEHQHPEYANRKVYNNLCINHPNDKPREIARRTLSAIAHAIGKLQVEDSIDLIGHSLRVKLKVVPPRDGYDARNEVSGYKSLGEAAPDDRSSTGGSASSSAAPAAHTSRPSWKR